MFNVCLHYDVLSVAFSLVWCVLLSCVTFLYGAQVKWGTWLQRFLIFAISSLFWILRRYRHVSATCFNWSVFRSFPDNHKTDVETLRHKHVLLIVRTRVAWSSKEQCTNFVITPGSRASADPEGGGGGRGSGFPLKNYQNIGLLSNAVPDPLKITKLPSQPAFNVRPLSARQWLWPAG